MKCPKCGKEVRAGAKFCGYCGAPLADAPHTPQASAPVSSSSKMRSGRWQLPAIAAILLLLIIGAFILFRTLSGTSTPADGVADPSAGYVAIYANGSYSLVCLDDKNAALPLGTIVYGSGSDYVPEVQFSSDGKYVFFYTTDSSGQNIQLCRAECSKLTTDLKKNQDLYTIVSNENFYYDLTPMENGILLLYNVGPGQSYYFDGSKTRELPEDWSSITFDTAGNYVYWSDDAIWRVLGGDLSSARQIDTGIDRNSVYFLDSDDLLYQKDGKIYEIGSDWTPHYIMEAVIFKSDDAIYYLGGSEGSSTLSYRKDGSTSLVADQISWYSYISDSNLLQYSTPDSDILLNLSSGQYAVATEAADASLQRCLSESGISDYDELSFFITESYFYVVCDDSFFASPLTDHVMGDFEQICVGVHPLTQTGDTIYCTPYALDWDNVYASDTIDLYAVKDGGMYLVASMLHPNTLDIYADGVMTAQGEGTNGPVWGRAKEGTSSLPDALYLPTYLGEERFLYRTETALYFYDAHSAEPVKLFDNPRWVWCSETKDFDFTLGIYD